MLQQDGYTVSEEDPPGGPWRYADDQQVVPASVDLVQYGSFRRRAGPERRFHADALFLSQRLYVSDQSAPGHGDLLRMPEQGGFVRRRRNVHGGQPATATFRDRNGDFRRSPGIIRSGGWNQNIELTVSFGDLFP